MNFVSSRSHRILTMEDTLPPGGEKLPIVCPLDRVTGNGEVASSGAETVLVPGKPTPIHIRRAIASSHSTQRVSGKSNWKHSGLSLHPAFAISYMIGSIPN